MAPGDSSSSGYLRLPTVHGDSVIFVCEDDLWSVPASGGRAWRLTAGGSEEGPAEVYVMPAEGGEARRLTFQAGGACTVTGWDPSGSVIYMSDAGLGQARRGW